MKIYTKGLCLALLLAAGSASASVQSLGTDVGGNFDTGMVYVSHGSFNNDWTFLLPAVKGLDVTAVNFSVPNFFGLAGTVSLFSGTPGQGKQVGSSYSINSASTSMAFSNLAAGNYYFQVTGATSHAPSGAYDLIAAPVPEPSTFALLGLGAAGLFWLRRRKTSVPLAPVGFAV